jgi:hypothetical protein
MVREQQILPVVAVVVLVPLAVMLVVEPGALVVRV